MNHHEGLSKQCVVLGVSLALVLAASMLLTPPKVSAQSDVASKFSWFESPRILPEVRFHDEQEAELTLLDFAGKVVVLNVWATWCVPCREEMPALDQLEAELGGEDFVVLPLSVDRAGVVAVQDFYAEIGIQQLGIYVIDDFSTIRALRVQGIPTTLLLDKEGREVARLIGPADWTAPEMVKFLREFLEGH